MTDNCKHKLPSGNCKLTRTSCDIMSLFCTPDPVKTEEDVDRCPKCLQELGHLPGCPNGIAPPKRPDERVIGRQLAEEGLNRAVDHADKSFNWSEYAFEKFNQYLKEIVGPLQEFAIEDFVFWFHAKGFIAPPDDRAFGIVTKKANKAKLIQFARVRESLNKNRHTGICRVYTKAI